MLPMEYTSSIGTQIHHTNIFFIYGNTIKEIEIKYEKYLTTYSHTYQIYKKNFIEIGRAVSEECDLKHRDTRFLYIKYSIYALT